MNEDDETVASTEPIWTKCHENILIDWADKAMCYRWLHARCNRFYHLSHIWLTIPVILLSTLTGTANFAQERLPEDWQTWSSMVIGSFNILAGFITTVHQFLKISELSEGHRVSAISWGKFYRNVRIELSKSVSERKNVANFLTRCKEEYDLLSEVSPIIRLPVIRKFKKKFKSDKFDFFRPEICDSLISTKSYIYDEYPTKDEETQILELIKKRRTIIKREEVIEKFIKNFQRENNREPEIMEIYDNLEDQISKPILDTLISRFKKNSLISDVEMSI